MSNKKKSKFSFSLFFLLLILATLAGLLVFSTSIKKITNKQLAQSGCPALSAEGLFDLTDNSSVWMDEEEDRFDQRLALGFDQEAQRFQVLGDTTEEKWIEVDLTEQRVKAHQGDKIIYDFSISSGKFSPTPTGEYEIWTKFKYTKMEGGVKGTGTYYYLSNVPYTMYFYGDYGLHGTYWHNSFGTPMSHGCVNLSISNSAKLFYWSDPVVPPGQYAVRSTPDNPGTKVVVHGRTPKI